MPVRETSREYWFTKDNGNGVNGYPIIEISNGRNNVDYQTLEGRTVREFLSEGYSATAMFLNIPIRTTQNHEILSLGAQSDPVHARGSDLALDTLVIVAQKYVDELLNLD